MAVIQLIRYKCYSSPVYKTSVKLSRHITFRVVAYIVTIIVNRPLTALVGDITFLLDPSAGRFATLKYKVQDRYLATSQNKFHSKACALLSTLLGFLVSCASLVAETNMSN